MFAGFDFGSSTINEFVANATGFCTSPSLNSCSGYFGLAAA